MTNSFNLGDLDQAFYADPYPTYATLRESTPVYCPEPGQIYLFRYRDIRAVYRDPHLFSSDKKAQFAPVFGADSALYKHHTTSLVFNDPPLHTQARKAIGNALSARMLIAMREGLEAVVEHLLQKLTASTKADLIADFAAAIPVEIIGNLLRVPSDERGPLRRWSLAILGALEVALDAQITADGNRAVEEFVSYLEDLVARRQQDLSDDEDDILARLIRWQQGGVGLSPHELYHQCIFLLNAGHETTTNLIGNGLELINRFDHLRDAITQDPNVIPSAVEEMLRYESSNQLGNRLTTAEVEIGGVTIPHDTNLTLFIGSANRDPAIFDQPDEFRVARDPNPHLAFGAGIHTCAGLNVARLEAQVAIERFISRFPNFELTSVPKRAPRARFRGFAKLAARLG